MRTVGYIPEEGAEQKKKESVTEQGGTPTPPEPKDDPVKKGGKKE